MDPNIGFLGFNLMLELSVLAWLIAQILKFFTVLITEHKVDWRAALAGGGMPSSHSALVCACVASAGYLYGVNSAVFAIATVMAVVVMYDASNVRRQAGEQAKVINYIMEQWDSRPEMFGKQLKELLGHTPLQVFMGALLGLGIGLGGCWLMHG